MPRSSKVEPCMLCGELPCECRAEPRKKLAHRIRRVEVVPLPETQSDMRAAMRIAASTPRPVVESSPSNWDKLITQSNEAQDEVEDAIKVLLNADILHPSEHEKYRHLIPVEDRAKAWKERNNGSNNTTC